MKSRIHTGALGAVLVAMGQVTSAWAESGGAENWKGPAEQNQFDVGILSGLGILDSTAGFALLLDAASKVQQEGFIPDINDSASIELQLGPVIRSSGSSFFYSTHLRWDFHKDQAWSFYGLGGVGGHITDSSLGSNFEIFPRFGAGALWHVHEFFSLRGELSHELIGVGLFFRL